MWETVNRCMGFGERACQGHPLTSFFLTTEREKMHLSEMHLSERDRTIILDMSIFENRFFFSKGKSKFF